MNIIKPYHVIETPIDGDAILKHIEKCGRTCYKSEGRITDTSAADFVRKIMKRGHESVIEHFSITVRFVCDRGVSHELVRHRLASFSQESTRYCNYSDDAFDNEITVIKPCFWEQESDEYQRWVDACVHAEYVYFMLTEECGASPQTARSVLPNSLKTEIVVTANLREWRTILKQRTARAAHPQMREIMVPLLKEMQQKVPVVFDDLLPFVEKGEGA